MSWWDTSNLTNLASQAIKTATKKIDKVLDIKEEDEAALQSGNDSFFSNWLNEGNTSQSVIGTSDTQKAGSDDLSSWLGLSPKSSETDTTDDTKTKKSASGEVRKSLSNSLIATEVSSFFSSWTGKDEKQEDESPSPSKVLSSREKDSRGGSKSPSSSSLDKAVGKRTDAGEPSLSISSKASRTPSRTSLSKSAEVIEDDDKMVDVDLNFGGDQTFGSSSATSLDEPAVLVSDEPAGNKLVNEPGGKIPVNELAGKISVNEPAGKISVNEPGGKVPVNEPGGKISVNEPAMFVDEDKDLEVSEERRRLDMNAGVMLMSGSGEAGGWEEGNVTFSMLVDSTYQPDLTDSMYQGIITDSINKGDLNTTVQGETKNTEIKTEVESFELLSQTDSSLDIEKPKSFVDDLVTLGDDLVPNVGDNLNPILDSVIDSNIEMPVTRTELELQKSSVISRIMSEGSGLGSDGTPMESSVETSGDDLSESNKTVCGADDSDETTPRNSAPDDDSSNEMTAHRTQSESATVTSVSESVGVFEAADKITMQEQEQDLMTGNWIKELDAGNNEAERSEYIKSYVQSTALHLEMSGAEDVEEPSVLLEGSPQSSDSLDQAVKCGEIRGDRNSDSPHSVTSNGSYVKNLLEDAMAETISLEERRKYGRGEGEGKGKGVRVGSAMSSGQTSGDEVDTTTSSDIEIISHVSSTPNGGGSTASSRLFGGFIDSAAAIKYRQQMAGTYPRPDDALRGGVRRCDHATSPQDWLDEPGRGGARRSDQATSPQDWSGGGRRGQGHHRTDSGSSAQSLQSRTSEDFPPESRHHRGMHERKHSSGLRGEAFGTDEKQNNPYDVDKLLKKLAEMAEVLDARERRQMELSEENIGLHESVDLLKNQLLELEKTNEAELEDVRLVREEFTRRMGEADRGLKEMTRERDSLKKLLLEAEAESGGKRNDAMLIEKLLKEKEQVIAELLEEGEKLSKQQLNSNNIIKKLRAKEKENDTAIKTFRQRCDEQKTEIDKLESILENKVTAEKRNVEAITQLNTLLKQQEEEISRLKNELEDATEKSRCMKVALDNSYKEISDLHKERVSHVSEVQASALNAEHQAKEQLKQLLDETTLQNRRDQEALGNQIEDLQLSLSRMEKEHGRREDLLRQEISDLQLRLQEAEERNQDLTQNMSAATRPLLRQIENIQSTYTVQLSTYERVEKNLTDRLGEAQAQLLEAQEKERTASDRYLDVSTKVTGLEAILANLREERSRLTADLEVVRSKLELLDEARRNDMAQKSATKQKFDLEISELKKEKLLVENQLEMEKMRNESEARKLLMIQDQLREKEMLLSLRASPSYSRDDSTVSETSVTPTNNNLSHEERQSMTTSAHGMTRVSVYDSTRQSSASLVLDSLQCQLKQREGEIQQLQNEIRELERTRESMARELVNQSEKNDQQQELIEELTQYKTRHAEVDGRYNALLQMYGEKVEETEELRLDLQDVKDMYKTQIDELLNRSPRGGT